MARRIIQRTEAPPPEQRFLRALSILPTGNVVLPATGAAVVPTALVAPPVIATGFLVVPAEGVVGAFDTVLFVDWTLVVRIEMHTGWPAPFAESNVTLTGRVPMTGVVGISTCTCKVPEASMRLVMSWNGTDAPPTEPITATYELSGRVNSKECRALSYT